jgi:two-component system, sensor histidine kinase and response regulator
MPGMDGIAVVEQMRQHPQLAATPVLLLSSGGSGDAYRCRQLGISAQLLKPIKQSELLDAILLALHLRQPLEPTAAAQAAAVPGLAPLRILLAEDNPVNQHLAVRLLEKEGHVVTLALNGREALDWTDRVSFDLVLMDLQMPEMDGLQATAAIRERDRSRGRHLPIVAMTAHALKGDRERCLQAGMDGYVAKPVQAQELFRAIRQVMALRQREETHFAGSDPSEEPPGVDAAIALARVGGDPQLLAEIIALFQHDAVQQLAAIRTAIERGDGPGLQRAAHTLAGSVGCFGASQVVQTARTLEAMGRTTNLEGALPAFQLLDRQLQMLQPALTELGRSTYSQSGGNHP